MKNRDHYFRHERYSVMSGKELHPGLSTGIFFIVLGLVLLAAFNDVMNWGSLESYFRWQTILIYIGVLMLLNLKFVGGLLVTAAGTWFLLEEMDIVLPPLLYNTFWPGLIICMGLAFIISSFFKRNRKVN